MSTPQGKSTHDPDGEWPSLRYVTWRIDGCFSSRLPHPNPSPGNPNSQLNLTGKRSGGCGGLRATPHQTHVDVRERTTATLLRFLRDGKVSSPSVALLAANFVTKRHHEAVRFSYLALKSPSPGAGRYSKEERGRLLTDMGVEAGGEKVLMIQGPIRDVPSPADVLKDTGFAPPLAAIYALSAPHSGHA